MVVFQSPHWFFLIPVLVAVGWFWKGLRLWLPIRALALLALVTVLADPHLNQTKRGMDLWVLVDRSESARAMTERGYEEWKRLLDRSKPTRYDRIRWINFAGESVEQSGAETTTAGRPDYTRTRLALETTLASLEPDRHARLLLFTDGFATEPLGDVGLQLEDAGVALDYRLLTPPVETDYQITALRLPQRKRPGEPFLVEVDVRGTEDGVVDLEISRNGSAPREDQVEIVNGVGTVRFASRLAEPGAHRYEVRLAVEDAYHGNNDYEGWIEIVAGPRVVLVTKYPDDPLAEILRAQGFAVELVTEPANLHPGQLSGTKVLVLNNVPAYEIPGEFLSAVDFFVRRQGGGLLMTGGAYSFGSGGYFESAVDPLLPVSMELKAEHRKLAVAMAIVMDRSGSMGMSVAGGKTKMDLANEGAARAVELLGEFDFVTVHAVDSSTHREVPLTAVGPHRGKIISRVRRIGSMGGGIFVYTGLKAGWADLKKAKVGQRHLILFSDAADSEEPGKYKELIAEMVAQGATISVIGLGQTTDSDAAFLEDIANRGNGRIFFTTDATTVPNIFAQETVAVARSLFVKDPVEIASTGQWLEISRDKLDWPGTVDGFNLSYARPEASVAAISTDEYQAPMVAYVQRGIGRSAAVSFPLGGDYSASVRNWAGVGDFVQTLTRWLMGEALPPGLGLRTDLDGTELTVDLLHDEDWTERLAVPPQIFLAEGRRGTGSNVREVTWERIEPGHFQASVHLEHGRMARGAVQVGNAAIPFGPLVVGGSPEWAFDRARVEELREISAQSGGEERVNLTEVWKQPVTKAFATVQPWLLVAALLLVLADALFTRMGWHKPVLAMPERASRTTAAHRAGKEKKAPLPVEAAEARGEEPTPQQAEVTTEEAADQRRSRFDRAKRRR